MWFCGFRPARATHCIDVVKSALPRQILPPTPICNAHTSTLVTTIQEIVLSSSESWFDDTIGACIGSCSLHIRKEGHRAMNRDEGSYQLSDAHTTAFLMRQLIVESRLGRNEYQLLLMKISWWDRNVNVWSIKHKVYMFGCDLWIFYGRPA